MIIVKTKMRRMPKSCYGCSYRIRAKDTIYERTACAAVSGYGSAGKPINKYGEYTVKPTKERPKWCPLKEEPRAAQD